MRNEDGAETGNTATMTFCKDWYNDYLIQNAYVALTAIIIVAINSILQIILQKLSKFEKKHTKTQEIYSNTIKMFVIQYVNTALIILLMNWSLSNDWTFLKGWLILDGEYEEFTRPFYTTVGSTLSLTMILNIFTPHISGISMIFIRKGLQWYDR